MTFKLSGGFVGSDPEELDRLARVFERQADEMREILSSSTWALRTAAWTGNRIEHIRSEWNRESRPALMSAAGECDFLARELRRNAEEQRRASGAGGRVRERYEPYPQPPSMRVTEVGREDDDRVPCNLHGIIGGIG